MKKRRKGTARCGVPQCNSYKSDTISMHQLPKRVANNPKELQRWKRVLRLEEPFPKYFFICSLHFEPNKIICPINRGQLVTHRLVDKAFPTLNLPTSSIPTEKCANRSSPYKELAPHSFTPPGRDVATDPEHLKPSASIGTQASVSQEDNSTQMNELDQKPLTFSCHKSTLVCDQYVQPFPFSCDTDEELKITTGIPTLALLEEFVKLCEPLQPEVRKGVGLSLKARIFLAMYRMKHKLSNAFVAVTFEISKETAEKYFLETMQLLAKANVINMYREVFEKIK